MANQGGRKIRNESTFELNIDELYVVTKAFRDGREVYERMITADPEKYNAMARACYFVDAAHEWRKDDSGEEWQYRAYMVKSVNVGWPIFKAGFS